MALIQCAECGMEFSDGATHCPVCWTPAGFAHRDVSRPQMAPEKVIEHLDYAKQLEVYKHTLEAMSNNTQYKIRSLGHEKEFQQPVNKADEAVDRDDQRVLTEKAQIKELEAQAREFSGQIQKIDAILEKLYSLNDLHSDRSKIDATNSAISADIDDFAM